MAAASLAVITMAGCHSAPPPGETARETPTSVITDVRRSILSVPARFDLQQVEFADASTGYATFWTAEPVNLATTKEPEEFRYASAVFATTDGGRTWRRLEDPRPPSQGPQMYTVDARTIVLESLPEGWYVSRDGGATFRFDAGPHEPPELAVYFDRGAPRLECETGCRLVGSGTLVQPGLPGELGAVTEAAGVVWTASLDDSTAYTALSRDHGETWLRRDVAAHPGGTPASVRMMASRDGQDVWLVGFLGGDGGGVGSVAPRRRKDVGVPLLWLWRDDRWAPMGTMRAPIPSARPYSVAPVGGGLVAVAGPHDGLALVDAAWHPITMSPRPEYVTTLRDGTVFAVNHRNQTYYLGTRTGIDVRWAQLILELRP